MVCVNVILVHLFVSKMMHFSAAAEDDGYNDDVVVCLLLYLTPWIALLHF